MDSGDIIEIHQLLGRYGHALDAADWERFAELFIADAVIDYTAARAPEVYRGIQTALVYFRGANHPSAHHVTNIVVTPVDRDRGRVQSKWFVPYTRPSHSPVRWAGGDYHDVVVRTADGWRIKVRDFSRG
ncbi:MAG TPA: nuclear transport factor 2 family protein, partial [Ilumatobacteraceae bacterium]|nr:nuclear transport factor 2 family protein [Ilumatobacteraceae bacterium]